MKNTIKVLGIIALVAVIGFAFIACDDGSKDDNGGGGGTFTLTNIPSEYNGKYLFIWFNGSAFWGTMSDSGVPNDYIIISNGRASVPLWEIADDGVGFQRYTRTETASCKADILNNRGSGNLEHFEFYSISFTNGSATKSWNDIDKLGY